ncbi:MAG: TorF family putative porin [Verrucomicrobiota bacterium]
MHTYCKTIGALAAASALVAGTASAEIEIEYEIHTGYTSEYIFRGVDLGNDLGEFGVDAATEYNGWGLSAGVWASAFDQQNGGNDAIDSEVDFYGEVSRDLGFATAAIGYIYYLNVESTNGGTDDQEVYFSLSRDLGFATVSATYYWDLINNAPGNDGYTAFAISKSWELNQCLTLNADSTLGYLVEEGQIAHWTTKVSLDWGFVENAKISPFVAFSHEGNAHGDTFWATTENELIGGSMLTVSF